MKLDEKLPVTVAATRTVSEIVDHTLQCLKVDQDLSEARQIRLERILTRLDMAAAKLEALKRSFEVE